MGGAVSQIRKKLGGESQKAKAEAGEVKKGSVEEKPAPKKEETERVLTEVDKKLLEALRAKGKPKTDGNGAVVSKSRKAGVNKVLLNFTFIQKTFKELRDLFNKADINGDGSLSFEEVKDIMNEICKGVNMQMLEDLFNEADISSDGDLQFKEFISLIAVANMLDVIPELSHPEQVEGQDENAHHFAHSNKVKKSFDLATEMYLAFDKEVKGSITYEEVERTFDESGESRAPKSKGKKQCDAPTPLTRLVNLFSCRTQRSNRRAHAKPLEIDGLGQRWFNHISRVYVHICFLD